VAVPAHAYYCRHQLLVVASFVVASFEWIIRLIKQLPICIFSIIFMNHTLYSVTIISFYRFFVKFSWVYCCLHVYVAVLEVPRDSSKVSWYVCLSLYFIIAAVFCDALLWHSVAIIMNYLPQWTLASDHASLNFIVIMQVFLYPPPTQQ